MRPSRIWAAVLPALLVAAWCVTLFPRPVEIRIEGSATIGDSLIPRLVVEYLVSRGVDRDHIGRPVGAIEAQIPGERQPVRFVIGTGGTHTAFDPDDTAIDIGMASRPIRDDEAAALTGRGQLKDPTVERTIGRDGVGIIVPAGLTVKSLTKDQLSGILSCRFTMWSQVGAKPDGPITVIPMDANSGTGDFIRDQLLGGQPTCGSAPPVRDGKEAAERVRGTPGAIGYVPLPVADAILDPRNPEQPTGLTVVPISNDPAPPLTPTKANVARESYLLARRLYLYLFPKPAPQRYAVELVDFAEKAGQKFVDEEGFAAIRKQYPSPAAPAGGLTGPDPTTTLPTCANPPPDYLAFVRAAVRRSTDVRFASNSDELDATALQEMKILVDELQPAQQVILAGFADQRGPPEVNRKLSRDRAEAVARLLPDRRVVTLHDGFGETCPTDPSDTEEGLQHNRRVEIWLRG